MKSNKQKQALGVTERLGAGLFVIDTLRIRLLLPIIISLLVYASSRADIFNVSDSSDTTNVTSLRGAIIAANMTGGNNTIILTNNIYTLTIPGADEAAGFTGDLDITNGNLTILGQGNSDVTIRAVGTGDRVIQILPGAQLTLSYLAITGGAAPGNIYPATSVGEPAGVIYNQGTLILENCVVTNNESGAGNVALGSTGGTDAGDGGGIYSSGVLGMFNCLVAGNSTGNGTYDRSGGNGGGIFNSGICVLNNCVVGGNFSGTSPAGDGGNGGGIYNSGTMTVNNSSVQDNTCGFGGNGGSIGGFDTYVFGFPGGAGGSGGGIYNVGTLTLNICAIFGNSTGGGGNGGQGTTAGNGGPGGSGAGIYGAGNGLTLITCTLGKNSCANGGDGGYGFGSLFYPGFAGNGGAGGSGAAVYCVGPITLLACTISGNSAGSGGNGGDAEAVEFFPSGGSNGVAGAGGIGGVGGVFFNDTNHFEVNLRNTLIALNSPGTGGNGGRSETTNLVFLPGVRAASGFADISGNFSSGGYNLLGILDDAGITNGFVGDLAGSASTPLDPRLGPLTNNGGSTVTFNLLPDSPAIDAGDDAILYPPYNLAIDQRGERRTSGAHVDIGAIEYNGLNNGVVQSPLLTGGGQSGGGFQISFNSATGVGFDVLASTNLTDWILVGPASELWRGWFHFEDPAAANFVKRFYRIKVGNQ
jgi:hypothetical protein